MRFLYFKLSMHFSFFFFNSTIINFVERPTSRTLLCNTAVISHMWLFRFKFILMKIKQNFKMSSSVTLTIYQVLNVAGGSLLDNAAMEHFLASQKVLWTELL